MPTDNRRANLSIEFFQALSGLNNDGPSIASLFDQIIYSEIENRPIPHNNGIMRELKSVNCSEDGSYFGIFAKIQHNDIPSAAVPGGSERAIPLADNEGIMEKLYFRFYPEFNILVIQRNRKCGTSGQLAVHLNRLFPGVEEQITFAPVLQPDSWNRLMSPNTRIKKIDLKVAKPSGNQFYPSDDFSRHMLGLIEIPGAANIAVTLSADLRSRSEEERTLGRGMKQIMQSLFSENDSNIERARVSTDGDDGNNVLIDLMADRLLVSTMVTMVGRYPDPVEIRQKLREEYANHHEILTSLFQN